jgi:uncharacterized damage-inducible protein DinB
MPERPIVYSPRLDAERPAIPNVGDEREVLTAFLDWHRATFAAKCGGLSREQLDSASVSPSPMSLHGLVRHLAAVERWWFQIQFSGADVPMLHYTDDDPDLDFNGLAEDPAEDFRLWREECEKSRAIVAAASLDDVCTLHSNGERMSLRRIVVHLIAEYARHNGHADLLRERIDGATGV